MLWAYIMRPCLSYNPPKRCLTFLRLGFLVVCKLTVKAASEAELQTSSLSIGTMHMPMQSTAKTQSLSQKPEVLRLFVLLIFALVPAVFRHRNG